MKTFLLVLAFCLAPTALGQSTTSARWQGPPPQVKPGSVINLRDYGHAIAIPRTEAQGMMSTTAGGPTPTASGLSGVIVDRTNQVRPWEGVRLEFLTISSIPAGSTIFMVISPSDGDLVFLAPVFLDFDLPESIGFEIWDGRFPNFWPGDTTTFIVLVKGPNGESSVVTRTVGSFGNLPFRFPEITATRHENRPGRTAIRIEGSSDPSSPVEVVVDWSRIDPSRVVVLPGVILVNLEKPPENGFPFLWRGSHLVTVSQRGSCDTAMVFINP